MKLKFAILTLFLLGSLPAFAESYNDDIYVDNSNKQYYNIQQTKSSLYPKFEGHVLAEYYINSLIHNKDKVNSKDNRMNYYLNAEALLKLRFTEGFFLETKWQLNPVNDRLYTGDIYANNTEYIVGNSLNSDFYGRQNYVKRKFQTSSYGLGIETLNIGYKNSDLAVALGKINPTFGKAFDKSRFSGIYGTLMPEEYELTEKIGGYISAILPVGTITLNTFFDDTTDLSRTMFNSLKRDKSKGGAGNTEKLNNFSLTYDGKFENLALNFGFRYLDVDFDAEEPEKGFVAGVEYLFELPYEVNFMPFVELAYFDNFDGMKSRNVGYFTTYLPIIIENWHFIFTNTTKYDHESGYKNYTSYLTQLSLGYKFDFGLMFDVARVWERYAKKADGFVNVESNEKWLKHADSWAVMVSYSLNF